MPKPTHQPRKRFGQHFLVDMTIVQHIVMTVAPRKDDSMVEIGPGLGVLTEALLPHLQKLDVVELDRDIIPKLKKTCLPLGNLHIHSADALKFDFSQLVQGKTKLRIVGNLPYNISTPLIFSLLDQINVIQDMHFMLQKEVVNRMVAMPGTSEYGRLSVMTQYYCQMDKILDVPPTAFSPPPKVESAVIRMLPHDKRPVEIDDPKSFSKMLTQAFSQKRKTLRNNLKKQIRDTQWQQLEIDPSRRAETLSLQEFSRIYQYINNADTHKNDPA